MIINSLLDQDLYKFTMQSAILFEVPRVDVEFKFKCRNEGIDFSPMFDEINAQLMELGELSLDEGELNFLAKLPYIKPSYIDFLQNFKLNPEKELSVKLLNGKDLDIRFNGSWARRMMYEILTMSIVNETYFNHMPVNMDVAEERLQKKIQLIKQLNNPLYKFSDFGGRRRLSRQWHFHVLKTLKEQVPHALVGTSNVMMAKSLGLLPIGTMAHEWLCAFQSLVRIKDFQKEALQRWCNHYRGDLGIALTDTIGIDAFLKDFDLYFAKLFNGVRHDSGDIDTFTEKVIAHYQKLKIDPMTKQIVYSDGLSVEKSIAIFEKYHKRIGVGFGIGTNLTNDTNIPPLNIVMKMISCDGHPVAKISDSAGKTMCEDEVYVSYLKSQFGIK
jgi:nicotinate phosphoribosyltransferase